MKEFNLSEKIVNPNDYMTTDGKVIDIKNVKEFIKRLKEEVGKINTRAYVSKDAVDNRINKLAGEKLV